jgi:hypothetical protein
VSGLEARARLEPEWAALAMKVRARLAKIGLAVAFRGVAALGDDVLT